MHFTTIVASVAVLAMGASALPSSLAPRLEPYVHIRMHGNESCSSDSNLGYRKVYDNQLNRCQRFLETDIIQSARIQDNPHGCDTFAYTDLGCIADPTYLPPDRCMSARRPFRSFFVYCNDHRAH
ncbi:hypothetical protein FDECE_6125 [Fusarium decemcellulare]|nr:hypothetical protein FDECE_6125 [Fusarium decemcellulare]